MIDLITFITVSIEIINKLTTKHLRMSLAKEQ